MKIYVTREIPEIGIKKLNDFCDNLQVNRKNRNLEYKELNERAADADAILTMLADKVDAEFLNSCEKLKVVANYAVGYNNIDIATATKNNIVVTNTPDVLTDTTADLAWALIMTITRRIVESDSFTRQGRFKGWAPELLCGNDVYGKTLGIVGAGRIGQATAKRAAGFDMNILYYNRSGKKEFESKTGAERVDLKELLKKADIISLHVPLTDDTRYLIDEPELKMMKKNSYLINTARGPVVNETALAKALKNGQIAGAALDVFENEPEVHPELIDLKNVVLTPHIGSATQKTRNTMAEMAAESIITVLSGEKPENIVNPEVYD
jgi:glyoxylate reductase